MSKSVTTFPTHVLCAPKVGVIASICAKMGEYVQQNQVLLIIEAMKVQTSVVAEQAGIISALLISADEEVYVGQALIEMDCSGATSQPVASQVEDGTSPKQNDILRQKFEHRQKQTLDESRLSQQAKRHLKGYLSARENLTNLCDPDSFIEYGQFAVAAQRLRRDYEELKTDTAADGVITGIASINSGEIGSNNSRTAVIINDYSVLAGTQGYYHHHKLDRMLDVASSQKLPIIMYTEGGGGRPGDTDITTVNSGLNCQSFSTWAKLAGVVPRIAVANGYCFAGNAALFGAADITIATKKSWIGMAGPAMIEGGGLGTFAPTEIGPIKVQQDNGVVDIVAEDETHATLIARQCLSYFQTSENRSSDSDSGQWSCGDQSALRQALPDDRRFVYEMRDLIRTLSDTDSFIEMKAGYGGAIITGFMRLQGQAIGLLASDCKVLGGAIDVDAGEKASEFISLCNNFGIPIVSLCDTPGFMVGPEHEKLGAVRRLSKLFVAGGKLKVPLVAVVVRKCYGLGAQALLGGSTSNPQYTISWPSGEFGGMGLEGAVKLGFKKQLAALQDPQARQALYDKLVAEQYQRGQASEVASILEIDAVIDPADTRKAILLALCSHLLADEHL
jgi:acetyl-CoA carboxylase carboxyltransferase component